MFFGIGFVRVLFFVYHSDPPTPLPDSQGGYYVIPKGESIGKSREKKRVVKRVGLTLVSPTLYLYFRVSRQVKPVVSRVALRRLASLAP